MCLLAVDGSSTLFVAGLLLIVVVILRRAAKKIKLSAQMPVAAPKIAGHQSKSSVRHIDAPAGIARWEVEMYELARDLSGQLDSKIALVQQLLSDVSEATARLEASLRQAEHSEADTAAPTAVEGQRDAIYRLADRGLSQSAIAHQLGAPLGDVELILASRSPAHR